MKYCYECGEKIGEKDKKCPNCGIKLKRIDEKMKASTKVIIVLLSMIAVFTALCSAVVISYVFMSDDERSGLKTSFEEISSHETQNTAASPTVSDAPSPSPSDMPKITSVPADSGGYSVYDDTKFDFSCAYPNSLIAYNDNSPSSRYTLRSGDGKGVLKICASDNSTGITTEQSLSVYKSKCGGHIEKQDLGKNYYEVHLRNENTFYYKFLRIANGNMYWFELQYDENDKKIYDEYIKYIYDSFTIE